MAIMIGDRAGLTADEERRLQDAGTYHVIAISGGNLAILAALLFGCLRLTALGPRSVAWTTLLFWPPTAGSSRAAPRSLARF